MHTPSFTAAAIGTINNAEQSAKRLHADLQALNRAMTTEGRGTVAERLAHAALLDILTKLAPATDALSQLATVMLEDAPL